MSSRLKKSGKGEYSTAFRASYAVVIGINDYGNGIQPLTTPVNDAVRLAEQLEKEHGYTVHLLVKDVTKARLEQCFTEEMPPLVGENDRLLVYFAGHGVALDGEDGPQGFLVPQDADPKERDSFLPMTELHGWLDALTPRHMLAILDCCFAGAFRWAATRSVGVLPEVIHQERFERYLISPAWQVLTSAAYDQRALDSIGASGLGARGVREIDGESHSPFALALYDALRGEGDLIPKGDGDGVITATELYLYLREEVEIEADVKANHEQTPGLWPLNKHGKGEYIFLTPGHELNLPPAPELTYERNPWRGLKSYDEEHKELFFGRDQEIRDLSEHVTKEPFTSVLGASGTGKSSLVKAGLMPHLAEENGAWHILPPLRPGATPLANLHEMLAAELADYADQATSKNLKNDSQALTDVIAAWAQDHPDSKLLLMVDQVEELVTLADDDVREKFLVLLAQTIEKQPEAFRLVTTLRTDFEPQFNADSPLAEQWHEARYVVPPMNQADLRQVIEGPASVRVLYFEPPELVDELITEVIQTPGALPLLSFTLSEMYIHYLKSGRDNRALTQEDYKALGGVIGALRNRANEEYEKLPDDAQRETMRRVMLRMISVEGGELARRRVQKSELVYADDAENERVDEVLDGLVEARLLVTGEEEGQPTVEPAHDALVLAWDNLLRWKKEAESYLPLQRRLAQAVMIWSQASPEARSGFLWDDDPRLPILEETLWPVGGKQQGLSGRSRWAKQILLPNTQTPADTKWLNGTEVAFVQSSVDERAKFWRRTIGIALTVFLVVGTLLAFGFNQQQQSTANATALATQEYLFAEAATAEAIAVAAQATSVVNEAKARAAELEVGTLKNSIQASQLAAASGAELANDQELALLLATAGLGLSSQPDTLARFYSASYAPFHHTLNGHQGPLRSASFSPDGQTIVTAGNDNLAKMWDVKGNELASLEGHTSWVMSAVFSPDGQLILTASADHTAKLWDVKGNELTALNGHDSNVNSAVFSPDGQLIVTTSTDGSAKVWDVKGNELASLGHGGSVESASFSPDGQLIVTAGPVHSAKVWDVKGRALATLEGHTSGINSAVFDIDGKTIVTASTDGSAKVWDVKGNELATLEGHTSGVSRAFFSPDGQMIVTAGFDGSARVWDTNGDELSILMGHADSIRSASFSPDGQRIVTASSDGSARVWDVNGDELLSLVGHEGSVNSANFSPDGQRVVTANSDGSAKVWNLTNKELAAFNWHNSPVYSVSFGPEEQIILTASGDGTAKLWDMQGNKLASFDGDEISVTTAAFSPDGLTVVTGGFDGIVRLWDTAGDELTSFKGHTAAIISVVFSPDGRTIITASEDGSAKVWDLAGSEETSLEGHGCDGFGNCRVNSANFSPDGQTIVTAGDDGKVKFWDVQGNEQASFEVDTVYGLNSAIFSPDGQVVVIVTDSAIDNSVRVWNVEGKETAVLEGHTNQVWSASFSPDGRQIVTTSLDGSARLWDVQGNELAVFEGHETRVNSASFSHDGKTIITAGYDGSTRLWINYPSIDDQLTVANKRLSRSFDERECRLFFRDDLESCPRTLEELFALFDDDLKELN